MRVILCLWPLGAIPGQWHHHRVFNFDLRFSRSVWPNRKRLIFHFCRDDTWIIINNIFFAPNNRYTISSFWTRSIYLQMFTTPSSGGVHSLANLFVSRTRARVRDPPKVRHRKSFTELLEKKRRLRILTNTFFGNRINNWLWFRLSTNCL